jgi:hypothetical protein
MTVSAPSRTAAISSSRNLNASGASLVVTFAAQRRALLIHFVAAGFLACPGKGNGIIICLTPDPSPFSALPFDKLRAGGPKAEEGESREMGEGI